MKYKLTVTVTTDDEYSDTADVSVAFDPPVKTKRRKPSTVEIYGAVVLKAITQRSSAVARKEAKP